MWFHVNAAFIHFKGTNASLCYNMSSPQSLQTPRNAAFSFAGAQNLAKAPPSNWRALPDLFGGYLPAHTPKAAAPQSSVDARLPDPGQIITVEEQVVPFFPAQRRRSRGAERFMSFSDQIGQGIQSTVSPSTKTGGWAQRWAKSLWCAHTWKHWKHSPVRQEGWLRLWVSAAVKRTSC